LKVLHVIPSVSDRSGGPAQAIFPMCRALQAKGVEILLVTTDAGLKLKENLPVQLDYKNVPTLFFPSQLGKSFKFSRPLAKWLDQNVASFDLVHVHAVFNHACIAAASACRKHGLPYVVRPLGTLDPWGMQQKRLLKSAFWHLSGKRMLRGASAVHYTARAEKEAVEESLGINHGNVVPLGIDLEIAESALNESQQHQLPAGPYVLVLSRLHPKKGLEILLEAFTALRQDTRFKEWRLVLAGDGPPDYVKVLRKKASPEVLFPGWLDGDAKKLFLRKAALLALPSYRENFGLCVLEALTCGVPVIVSPHVNLSEAIEAAGAGWIAAVDASALAETLKEALGSESERAKRGEAGKLMAQRFTWPEVAGELLTMYSNAVKSVP
jgi:glycosyltransferase involved in cell wall biosynthesis